MKKLVILILFFMAGCAAADGGGIVLDDLYLLSPIDAIFLDEHGPVFVTTPEWATFQGELRVHRLNRFDDGGFGLSELHIFEGTPMSWPNIAYDGQGNIFMPLIIESDGGAVQKIHRFNTQVRQRGVVYELSSMEYVNIFVHDESLIIFQPYTISKLDLTSGVKTNIIEEEGIINIFVYNGSILLAVDVDGGLHIDEYDFNGQRLSRQTLNIQGLTRLYRLGDFFVFETLHDGVSVYRQSAGGLTPIPTPESLSAATVIWPPCNDATTIYFWDNFENALYIMYQGEFSRVGFEVDMEFVQGWAHRVVRDVAGNLLLQFRADAAAHAEYLLARAAIEGGPTGGAFLMVDDTFVFYISIDEINASSSYIALPH